MSPKLIRRADDNLPWAEKYRPKQFDEIRGNPSNVEALQRLASNPRSFPNLLLAGSAGTGKTSAAAIVADAIGATSEKMNASNERNIDVIRNKVREYATTASLDGKSFKILIMEECDGLTPDAQRAMKDLMEDTTVSCRFFLVCNDTDKLIKPIRSRCSFFWFDPIPDDEIRFTLEKILEAEDYTLESEAGDMIVSRARGDLRVAINTLQMVCDGSEGAIETDRVRDLLQASEVDGVSSIIQSALGGRFDDAMQEYHSRFKGYAGAQDFSEMVTRDLIQHKFGDRTHVVARNLPYLQMGGGRNDYLAAMGFLARLGEQN